MFTTSVANIGPNEEIVVAIEYQETLRYDDGTFSLRFPLAITPRYIPGTPLAIAQAVDGGSPRRRRGGRRDRITPPVAAPGRRLREPGDDRRSTSTRAFRWRKLASTLPRGARRRSARAIAIA